MENANSPEYLEKIKNQLVENLRRTAHAPSVQMQDVPRHSMGAMSDEEDAELDDLDEDENKDVRMTQRQWEQHIEQENEYEESDHEDLDRANGVHRNGSTRPSFNDYRNSDVEADSRAMTPANGQTDSVINSKETDDVAMEDTEEGALVTELDTSASPKRDDKEVDEEVQASGIAEQEEALKKSQDASKSDHDNSETAQSATLDLDWSDKTLPSKEDEVMQDADGSTKPPAAEAEKASSTPPDAKDAPALEKVDADGDVDMDKPAPEAPMQEENVDVKKEPATEETGATTSSPTAKTDAAPNAASS